VFILRVDDLAYHLFVPSDAKTWLASVQTFKVRDGFILANSPVANILKLATVCAGAGFIALGCIENAEHLKDLRGVLCGGNQDFVYSAHAYGPLAVADTPQHGLGGSWAMQPGIADVVSDWAFSYDPAFVRESFYKTSLPTGTGHVAVKHLTSPADMHAWLATDPTDASAGFGTSCRDQERRDFPEGDWLWSALEALTGATTCAQAKPFCDLNSSPLVRLLCPTTCGCFDAASGLFVDEGCRPDCLRDEPSFTASLQAASCQDLQLPGDPRSVAWQRWWGGFNASDRHQAPDEVVSFARDAQGDCSFLLTQDWARDYFCHGAARPGTPLCPVSCGCPSVSARWCPESCG